MNKIAVVFAAFLLLAVPVSAGVVLEIIFGPGVQHSVSEYSTEIGRPNTSKYFYVDIDDNYSELPADADEVSIATATGTISFEELDKEGECSWYAVVGADASGTRIDSASLNGTAINTGDKVFWSAKPNTETVERCRLEFDLNVTE